MLPNAIFVILVAAGSSSPAASASWTYPRLSYKHWRNDTSNVKSAYNPDAESINYHNTRPVYYDPYKPDLRGYARRGNEIQAYTPRIYRSYGRGKAEIPYMGATVSVLNTVPGPKVQNELIPGGRVASRETPEPDSVEKRKCKSCPRNRRVVASKGNAHVILPQPCPDMKWYSLTGPKPGAFLKEGTYTLLGRLGSRGKLCQYKYKVLIRRCGALNVKSGSVKCTAEDAWGSECEISCHSPRVLQGPRFLECQDDLKWSSNPPVCKHVQRSACSYPRAPNDSKMSCQVPGERELDGDVLPEGTSCRFRKGTRQWTRLCEYGRWVRKGRRDVGKKIGKRRKHMKWKPKPEQPYNP